MTRRVAIAGGAVAVALAAIGAGGAALVAGNQQAVVATFPPQPANLRAYEVGQDYVKVSFGPSIVGPLSIAPFPNGKGAKITWGGAIDTLYPLGITYTFSKNGKALWKDRAQTFANVGFTLAVRTFKTCIVPHSTSGFGPKRCVTWTAP